MQFYLCAARRRCSAIKSESLVRPATSATRQSDPAAAAATTATAAPQAALGRPVPAPSRLGPVLRE